MFCDMCYFCVLVLILQNLFVCAVEIKRNLKLEMETLTKKLPDRKFPLEPPAKPPKRWKYKDYLSSAVNLAAATYRQEHQEYTNKTQSTWTLDQLGCARATSLSPYAINGRYFDLVILRGKPRGFGACVFIVIKFDATTIYERAQRRYRRAGLKNVNRDAIFEEMMKGIDPTDELLRFKVDRTNWNEMYGPEFRRAYLPPGTVLARTQDGVPKAWAARHWVPDKDSYGVRPRIFELMKQLIYQARDSMTYMQKLREELNSSAVYKMGFLVSKTDQKIKDYHKIIFKSFILCNYVRQYVTRAVDGEEIMTAYERAVMHWFEAELLWDLVNRNDRICKEVIKTFYFNRKEEFNKVFVE